MLEYRMSTFDDVTQVNKLFRSCFYDFDQYEASYVNPLYKLDGRYALAIDSGMIVGMCGLCNNGEGAYEVDYLCVDENYRGHGVASHLLEISMQDTDYKEVWFEAWEWDSRVESFLAKFGFKLYEENFKTYVKRYHKCADCIRDKGDNCKCLTKLYVKESGELRILE